MTKPPMFAPPRGATLAQDYMHRARASRAAAIGQADYVGPELNWPKFGQITLAIELALKAYVLHTGKPVTRGLHNHDLVGWYQLALNCGLQDKPGVAEAIKGLNELHLTADVRYPRQRSTPMPSPVNIADDVVDHLLEAITPITNPG